MESKCQNQRFNDFLCKNKRIQLRKYQTMLLQADLCLCGCILCHSPPRIINKGQNSNKSWLFYYYSEDAENECNLYYSQMKTGLCYIPAKGKKHANGFCGFCQVCQDNYRDYIHHIKSQKHKTRIKSSEFDREIHCLCSQLARQKQKVKLRQKGLKFQQMRSKGKQN